MRNGFKSFELDFFSSKYFESEEGYGGELKKMAFEESLSLAYIYSSRKSRMELNKEY